MAPKPLSISQDEPLHSLVNGDGDIVCTVIGHKYDLYKALKACYTACKPIQQAQ